MKIIQLRTATDHRRGAWGDAAGLIIHGKESLFGVGPCGKSEWLVRTAKLLPRGWGLAFGNRIGVNGVKAGFVLARVIVKDLRARFGWFGAIGVGMD